MSRRISIGILIFIIASFSVGGWHPLLVPAFLAGLLQGVNPLFLTFVCYAASLSGLSIELFVKYGLIVTVLALVLHTKNYAYLKEESGWIYLFTALFVLLADITYITVSSNGTIFIAVLEATIVMTLSGIYEKGLSILQFALEKIVVDNTAMVSVTFLFVSAALGLPVSLFGIFRLCECVCLFVALYTVYRFGLGVSTAMAAGLGIVLFYKTGEMPFVIYYIVLATVCSAIITVVNFKKLGILLGVVLVTVFGGMDIWPYILTNESLRALVSGVAIFLMTPPAFMSYTDECARNGRIYESSDEWGRLFMKRINTFANAMKRVEYNVVPAGSVGISFDEIGDVLLNMSEEFENAIPMKKHLEAAIVTELLSLGATVKSIVMSKDKLGHHCIYVTLKMKSGKCITREEVRRIIEAHLKLPIHSVDEGRNIISDSFGMFVYAESPRFKLDFAVRRSSLYENEESGDNYIYQEEKNGQTLIILSDGMGSGSAAAKESERVADTILNLFEAGFTEELALKFINSYLAGENMGENFATLDMIIFDGFTGTARFFKAGAAASFIVRGNTAEIIESTSLPVGIVEDATFEFSVKRFEDGDKLLLVSDGVLDTIAYENKEDFVMNTLMKSEKQSAKELADEIYFEVMTFKNKRIVDDITILTAIVKER